MNRTEFLDNLEKRLDKLPADEKNDALNYYRELFDDAGSDREQQIIEDLGSPEDIAEQILRENGISSEIDPECLPETVKEGGDDDRNTQGPDIVDEKPLKNNTNTLLLVIVILILTAPIWGGLVTGILGAVFGIFVAVFAVLIAFCAAGIALIAAGVAITFNIPPVGLMISGIGLMLFGISVLVFKPALRGLFKLSVNIVNKIVELIRRVFNKKESVQ